jgi:hypothetical protein
MELAHLHILKCEGLAVVLKIWSTEPDIDWVSILELTAAAKPETP